jgi:hypothetical protein
MPAPLVAPNQNPRYRRVCGYLVTAAELLFSTAFNPHPRNSQGSFTHERWTEEAQPLR